jgi:hypothetical protein
MRLETFVIISAILCINVATAACSTGDAVSQKPSPQVSTSPTPRMEVEPSYPLNSSIRSIDFASFTYPATPIYSKGAKSFTLQNGKYQGRLNDGADIPYPVSLVYLIYGDVTGDGAEEAMAILFENVKGTAIPYYVYIYTLEKGSPKLLWAFETGDRADRGLRQVYAENGELVIEQFFNPDPIIGKCPACPTHFTRRRYEWGGNSFRQKGKKEVLPNPTPMSPASPIMPRYSPVN